MVEQVEKLLQPLADAKGLATSDSVDGFVLSYTALLDVYPSLMPDMVCDHLAAPVCRTSESDHILAPSKLSPCNKVQAATCASFDAGRMLHSQLQVEALLMARADIPASEAKDAAAECRGVFQQKQHHLGRNPSPPPRVLDFETTLSALHIL